MSDWINSLERDIEILEGRVALAKVVSGRQVIMEIESAERILVALRGSQVTDDHTSDCDPEPAARDLVVEMEGEDRQ